MNELVSIFFGLSVGLVYCSIRFFRASYFDTIEGLSESSGPDQPGTVKRPDEKQRGDSPTDEPGGTDRAKAVNRF